MAHPHPLSPDAPAASSESKSKSKSRRTQEDGAEEEGEEEGPNAETESAAADGARAGLYYGFIADGLHTHPTLARIVHAVHPRGLHCALQNSRHYYCLCRHYH